MTQVHAFDRSIGNECNNSLAQRRFRAHGGLLRGFCRLRCVIHGWQRFATLCPQHLSRIPRTNSKNLPWIHEEDGRRYCTLCVLLRLVI